MGGLVEHGRAGVGGHLAQPRGAARALSGQEALEGEATGGQAARDQGGDRRRRAGHDLDDVTSLDGGPHEALPWIGDPRHPGVGDDRHPFATRQPVEDPGDRPNLRVVVHHHQRAALDAGVLEQAPGPPGVLTADGVRGGERARRPAATGPRGSRSAFPPARAARVTPPARGGRRRRGASGRSCPPRPRAPSGHGGRVGSGGGAAWTAVRRTVRSPSSHATSIANRIPSVWTDRAGTSRSAPSIESRPSKPRRRAGRVSATSNEASTSPSRSSQPMRRRLASAEGRGVPARLTR